MPQPKPARKKYRLIAGYHQGPDYKATPTPILHPITGQQTGERYPSKLYGPGDVVESETDLTKLQNKFELINEPRGPVFNPGASVAPGGQVGSGKQVAEPTGEDPAARLQDELGPEEMPAAPPDLRRERAKNVEGDNPTSAEASSAQPNRVADWEPLEEYKVDELRAIANDQKIELHGARTKDDIIKRLRESK